MREFQVFDIRFEFSMSKSPTDRILMLKIIQAEKMRRQRQGSLPEFIARLNEEFEFIKG